MSLESLEIFDDNDPRNRLLVRSKYVSFPRLIYTNSGIGPVK